MALSQKQRGVGQGMALAMLLLIGGVTCARYFAARLPLPQDTMAARLSYVAPWLLLLVAPLAGMIGNLARHRFFSSEDIDGSGLTEGTEQARIYQSILQNTLEQLALAFPLHLIWALWMPRLWLGVLPLLAGYFFLGRILFAAGYRQGAARRAVGFALTFYSNIALLLLGLLHWLIGL